MKTSKTLPFFEPNPCESLSSENIVDMFFILKLVNSKTCVLISFYELIYKIIGSDIIILINK